MGKIHQLSETIIARIAAGEVIERPAYAVKELVENAIDANASQIKIDLEESGLQKISVTDNGEGMSKEDISICFQSHTTSKLSSEDDLIGIQSMGFRGEALASISTISNMTIRSKREKDVAGTEIQLIGGTVEKISPRGIPTGTQIIIEQLFYPVPVRKKFLKTSKTEFRLCIEILTNLALAHPKIRFIVSHNKKQVFDLPSTEQLQERLILLLGDHITKNLIPILYEDSYMSVSGFIAKPNITTASANKQFLFVNKRMISDKLISLAIKEAYGNLLDSTSLPIFILFVSLPFETVDVNIHPRKDTVNFIDRQFIFETVKSGIRETLEKHSITFTNISWQNEMELFQLPSRKGDTRSSAGVALREQVLSVDVLRMTKIKDNKELLQVHNLYLMYQTSKGIMYVDQHAAHERILYEQFKEAFLQEKEKLEIYTLENRLEFTVSLEEALLLEEYMIFFTTLGFTIKKESPTTFSITQIPALFKQRNIFAFLKECLEDVALDKQGNDIDKKSHRMLAYLACRSAIKAGDALTTYEAKNLLDALEKTKNNATCPHGRPTTYQVPLSEIHKQFKR